MKKYKYEMKEIEVITTEDILCNKCGNSCMDKSGYNYEGIIEYEMRGGYGSKLGDMVGFRFSLCETCLEELFKTFKLNPLNPLDYEDETNDCNIAWEHFKKSL